MDTVFQTRDELLKAIQHLVNVESIAKATMTPRAQAAATELVDDAINFLHTMRS